MSRRPNERIHYVLDGTAIRYTVTDGLRTGTGTEQWDTEELAANRYDEMKFIAAIDFGFHVFLENFDGQ